MTDTTERTPESEQEVKQYRKWYEPKTTSESQFLNKQLKKPNKSQKNIQNSQYSKVSSISIGVN